MKTLRLKSCLLTLIMILIGGNAMAIDVEIGDASKTSSYIPLMATVDNYSTTEATYTPAEIGLAGTITAISYNAKSVGDIEDEEIEVYMRHRTNSTYSSANDYVSESDLTKVYSGTVSFVKGWNKITLSTAFKYNGTDNLEIVVCKTGEAGSSSEKITFYCSAATNQGLYRYSTVSEYGSISSYDSFKRTSTRADMKLTFESKIVVKDKIKYECIGSSAYAVGIDSPIGDITIPSTISTEEGNTYNVILSKNIFSYLPNITGVTIQVPIASLESNMFEGCSSLEFVTLPASVTTLPNYTFKGCTSLKSIEIPSTITSLGSNLFEGCTSLETVTFHSSITSLPAYMFSGCTSLKSVEIPSTITSLGNNLFDGCTGLTSVTIPSSVASLSAYMFNGCTSLTSLEIPSSVISLGNNLFDGCTGLTSVTIPSSVTSLSAYMFNGCTGLTSFDVPSFVTSFPSHLFNGCTGLTSLEIPATVTSIEIGAFNGCSSLSNLTFLSTEPATLTSSSAISYSTAIYVPKGSESTYKSAEYWSDHTDLIVAIGSKTEYDLTGSNKVTEEVGRSILEKIIGESNLSKVISLSIEGTINSYDLMVMRNKMVALRHLDLSKAIIKANVYEYYTNYCSENNTLRYWSLNDNLYSVKLPTSLTKIADNAFSNLKNITDIEIPASVTEIGDSAFAGMTSLKTVIFAEDSQCTSIGQKTFEDCSALTGIRIPEKVEKINANAFHGCAYLTELVLEDAEKPLSLVCSSEYTDLYSYWINDDGCYNSTPFYSCPINKLYIGREIEYDGECWYRDRLCLGMSNLQSVSFGQYVSAIDDVMFAYCSILSEVKGMEHIKTIGDNAFYQCVSLRSITMSSELTTIGSCAFRESGLMSVDIPSSVIDLGTHAFRECENLVTFTFEDNKKIKSIPDYFLYGATKLAKIALPDSVETIGNYAFYGCTLMTECRISRNITQIGDYAFNQCNDLNSIYAYTTNPQQIDQNTFSTYHTATLYVPLPSRMQYYYNTQWSQFLNLVGFDYTTDQVGFTSKFDLYTDDAIFLGYPRADVDPFGSLHIHGSRVQPFGDIHLKGNGNRYGSLIASGNLTADKIYFDLSLEKDKWYFFCFPFDIPMANITKEGSYSWAEYDGEARATKGTTGWKKLDSSTTTLKKGKGYIFRTNYASDLTLRVDNPTFDAIDEQTTLTSYTSTSTANADWNMVGNPYPCYYPICQMQYGAPIIVWNSTNNTYDAYRPGDDEYVLHPYEAFFVQKPEKVSYVGFVADGRQTYEDSQETTSSAKAIRSEAPGVIVGSARKIINMTLSNGDVSDKTRVVINSEKSASYERDCDAAKFVTATAPQLYTIGSDNTKYAINERPVANGRVTLGFYAPEDGMYTLSASRMDVGTRIYDAQTSKTYDLADGEFTFNASKGTDNSRFSIIFDDVETGVDAIENAETSVGNCYNLKGQKVNNATNGVYIENGKKIVIK